MDVITIDDIKTKAPASSTYVQSPYTPITPNGNVINETSNNVIVDMVEENGQQKKPYILPTVLSVIGVYIAYKTLI